MMTPPSITTNPYDLVTGKLWPLYDEDILNLSTQEAELHLEAMLARAARITRKGHDGGSKRVTR